MKTIRQIADEIGVSKQAVYKRYKGKLYTVCAPYAHTEQGVLYLSEQAETLIKQDFLRDGCPNGSHTDTHTERSIGAVPEQSQEAGVVAILQATIDTLQGQLSVKDKQIEELNARLAEVTSALVVAQQTAQAAQALHAGTIRQQLTDGEDDPNQQGQTVEQNITFCNDDLKQVYHELFDEALAAYNAKKKKTRDKIPDYYEHIRQSKQEKLFHEAIFQIGNMEDCGCGSPGGERAAAALKEFAESFQERNPHLRVFNMVLHMDEATPHLHVDFVPVATGQSRGLSTRVSMKQALKQQGFESLGRKQTEWKAWMEREKVSLGEIAQVHDFEIISLGGGRPHMDLPEYRAAAQRLEAVQEQVAAAEQDIATLEKQKKALQGNVKLLKAVEKVKPDLEAIQPEKTLTGAVKGVTVEQVKELKAAAIRGAAAEQKVQELKEENQRLQQKIPSTKEKLKEAQERQRLENQNRKLLVQVECLEQELEQERSFSDRLLDGVSAVMDFLDRHLPEKFRPLVERARELLPVPEVQQPEQEQERGHTWGGMEL